MSRVVSVALAFALSLSTASCKGVEMKPVYPQAVIQPVKVESLSDTRISLRYRVHPESGHYSAGVDYEHVGDTLRVVVSRCAVGGPCEPMARSVIPLGGDWQAEVHLPYQGERVIVVHSDGEQQVYP